MLTFFTPGPSDSGLFDNVFNVTADTSIAPSEALGNSSETTQINLTDGGSIGVENFDDSSQVRISNTELNVTGGIIGNQFTFSGNELNFSGGLIEPGLNILGGVNNISGGEIGDGLRIIGDSSLVNISGGVIGRTTARAGEINISGGTIGSFLGFDNSRINVSGGVIGDGTASFSVSGSLDISGGEFQNRLSVGSGGEVNLFVLEYQIDGQSPESQAVGETVTIADRNVTISGVLADGTSFSFDLATGAVGSTVDTFSADATLNVMLVDETGIPNEPALVTGDLNVSVSSDGFVFEVSGQLNTSDSDLGAEDRFIRQSITEGDFGDFTLNTSGGFNYEIDTAAVGTLFLNDSVSDSFDVTVADGTTETVTITINGVELPPASQDSTITGDLSGSGLATDSTITGIVSVADPDVGLPFEVLDSASGDLTNQSQSVSDRFFRLYRFEITERTQINEIGGLFRTFVGSDDDNPILFAAINSLTSINDLPDNLDLTGDDLLFRTEFSIPSGTQVSLAPVTGLILEPGAYSLTFGTDDLDAPSVSLSSLETREEASRYFNLIQSENIAQPTGGAPRFIINGQQDPPNVSEVVPQTGVQGDFGVFNIDAEGNWNYVINNAAVESLVFGESEIESFEIVSIDGTATETITVTINGINQAVTATNTTLEVREDAIDGSLLGTVIASDPDGDAPAISIVSGNEAGVFAIDAAGNVTLADASQLDFDTTPEYVLVFEASDGLTFDSATLTINVVDVPKAAVIGGDITGTTTEDRVTTGLLTISDADGADEEAFVAGFIRGTYGQIGIQADGNYRYTPFTTPITQALRAGEIVVDTFTLTSVDGTTVDVTISIEGVNDPATFPNTAPVQISEDATAPLTGRINVEDRDAGESEIIPSQQIGNFGVFEIDAAGQWSYTVDSAAANRTPAGQESNDFFVITSLDGSEQDFLVQVVGVNDAAVITGDTIGTIDEDALQSVSGVLAVADPDFNQSRLAPQQTAELGDFGTFQYNALGRWFYTVDNEAAANLNATESATDTFEVSSFDGSATVLVTITIEGRNDYFDDVVSTEAGVSVTFNVFDNDQVAGDVVVTSNLAAQGGDISIGANGEVTYTPSDNANLNGTDSFQLTFEDENGNIGNSNVSVTVNEAAPVEDIFVFGTTQDDFLEGNDLNNVLIGDRGSDVLVGSRGNDIFITDAINGNSNGNDRDIIMLGNVDGNDSGNDVVTDFDVNGTNGGENNFDALEFTFGGNDFSISTRNDIRRFVRFIERDGDVRTDAILDGNDLILVFGRDSDDPSIITSSVRLEDVVGQNGLTQGRLRRDSVDLIGTAELDVFFASGAVEVGSTASESLVGGAANDVIVGGAGSDTLFGGAGNDTLTGDQTNGGIFGNDQDTFAISEIAPGNVGNDVITDFDTNNFNGGENNYDTLTLTLGNQDFSLSTGQDFLEFAEFLDNDGNDDTQTLIDGNDIIFVFGRNDLGFITDSVRLQDIIGGDGLTNASLAAFNRVGESGRLDVFIV
ncbi:VCBS domain-containing protein [Mariniblastus sp.]|nr:VCBS domain-containing protein [Mariniblastus sp.]